MVKTNELCLTGKGFFSALMRIRERLDDDFSETNGLTFVTPDDHPDLEQPIKIRMQKMTGNWWYFTIYDHIKVYAVPPPPKGTVIMLF